MLCSHHCRLKPNDVGACHNRINKEGKLVPCGYGCITSLALDPIEKKPLARFFPGTLILSAGSFGCNFHCPFCQNYTISQSGPETTQAFFTPEELTSLALRTKKENGNIGLAFTYNEPLMNLEYVRDTAAMLKKEHLVTVLVTNGGIAPDQFRTILPLIDAMNIDLKGFTDSFYQWVGGSLNDVKINIEAAVNAGIHIELTTLVIPGRNDHTEEMEKEASWIASLSPDIPLHLSRYFPRYRCRIPATPPETLYRLKKTAEKYLQYVYLGNV